MQKMEEFQTGVNRLNREVAACLRKHFLQLRAIVKLNFSLLFPHGACHIFKNINPKKEFLWKNLSRWQFKLEVSHVFERMSSHRTDNKLEQKKKCQKGKKNDTQATTVRDSFLFLD